MRVGIVAVSAEATRLDAIAVAIHAVDRVVDLTIDSMHAAVTIMIAIMDSSSSGASNPRSN